MLIRVPMKSDNLCLYGEGYPFQEKIVYSRKISLNSTINLNYKETSLDFIAGERKKSSEMLFIRTIMI
jgi:hypothetical protein